MATVFEKTNSFVVDVESCEHHWEMDRHVSRKFWEMREAIRRFNLKWMETGDDELFTG